MGKRQKKRKSVAKKNSLTKSKGNGRYIIENKKKLIQKRKKKRIIKRCVFFLIVLVATLITLALKHPYFNIDTIEIQGNDKISSKEIERLTNLEYGSNVFKINTKEIKNNILSNPYLLSAEIKRKLPKKVEISVKERTAEFYSFDGKQNLIIDEKGIVLEKRNDIEDMKLVKLEGFQLENVEIGKVLPCEDNRKIELIGKMTELIHRNKSGIPISVVSIENLIDINVYCGEINIKLGTTEKLTDKLNKGINIIQSKELNKKRGYIDVSFEGNPVVFLEEWEE